MELPSSRYDERVSININKPLLNGVLFNTMFARLVEFPSNATHFQKFNLDFSITVLFLFFFKKEPFDFALLKLLYHYYINLYLYT